MRGLALAALLAVLLTGGWLLAQPVTPPFYTDKSKLLQYLDADRQMQPIRTAEDWPTTLCLVGIGPSSGY